MSAAFPRDFRKLTVEERRAALKKALALSEDELAWVGTGGLALADVMIESAVGFTPTPLGIATGFLIDGNRFEIPMAVEEPSVVAAATFAARLCEPDGGFTTWATEPVMAAQLFVTGVEDGRELAILDNEKALRNELSGLLASITNRGGGFRELSVERLAATGIVRVNLYIDVRDIMGANLLNTAAEQARPRVEEWTGGNVLMAILSNEAERRRAGASFEIPLRRLGRGGFSGENAAHRIELASAVAAEDPSRAVTHNKGIMNGISALALATGNDTRAIEAGVHRWACRDGRYRGVTTYRVQDGTLTGSIEVPLPFASVGGSVGLHPATALALRILGNPDGKGLARIAAALGLAQNFAALFALVTEGIQKGHMKHHSARLALKAGAVDAEIRELADRLSVAKTYTLGAAETILAQIRKEKA